MRRRSTTVIVALALALAGCSDNSAPQAVQAPAPTVPAATAPAPAAPEPTLSPTASPTPSPTASRKPLPPPYDVKAVQTRLTALRYYIGAVDGERGSQLRASVMAFQKVNGLGADGTVGPKTLAQLKTPVTPKLRGSGNGTRVEVDLTKQVMYVVKDGVITRIMPISSGNGETYLTKKGNEATALSPTGYFKVQRRIIGERKADLGVLYDPQYFYKGWAIHGSNSVPAFPASHGCVRVTRTDAKWLLKQINVGTSVYLYGGKHTFTAGSSAPGTDDPGGDTPDTTVSEPTEEPTASPTASPAPSPSGSGTPTPAPSPSPSATILP